MEVRDTSRWIIIYPIYLNSKKTLAEGRRIAVSSACENPTCSEISDCCTFLNLPHSVEANKAYPRDATTQIGRVRVQLKKDDGSLVNTAIPSRKALMMKLAEMVPKHVGRRKGEQGAASSNAGGSGGGKSGKSGKKKK